MFLVILCHEKEHEAHVKTQLRNTRFNFENILGGNFDYTYTTYEVTLFHKMACNTNTEGHAVA
jgi:hypothetical protein